MSTTGHREVAPAVPVQEARDLEIAEFFAAHQNRIRGYLIGICGCAEHEADDVVQDTILLVREYWERVRALQKPEAYWYKIAGRRWRRLQGERAREHAYRDPQEHLRDIPAPADPLETINSGLAAMAILRRLPLKQRQVLWLRLGLGFSTAETAGIMDISEGTVKSQLHDAKAGLERLRLDGATGEADIR